MLIVQTFLAVWPLCVGFAVFFCCVSLLTWFLRIPRLDWMLPARTVFGVALIAWLLLLSVLMTLIDSPHLHLSKYTIDMLFMVSAFLGLPLSMPMLASCIFSLVYALRGERVRLSSLLLVSLGTFALGCVTSNLHDVAWCGIITDGFSKHYAAGGDLDAFVWTGMLFGIKREVLADYATLGPCAIVLVLGELLVAITSFGRLGAVHKRRPQ